MGILDRFRGKKDDRVIPELETTHPSTLQTFEEKTGLQIVIMNEAKKEKMNLTQQYEERLRQLRNQYNLSDPLQAREFNLKWIELIEWWVNQIAVPYGRGGDNPKFQKLYTLFSRVLTNAKILPSLAPYVEHAARILISASQFDKDVAINTPVIIKKEYPEPPKFELPTIPSPGEKRIKLETGEKK